MQSSPTSIQLFPHRLNIYKIRNTEIYITQVKGFFTLAYTAKVKVKLSLCLTKHHAMKTYWRSGGIFPRIF